MVTGDQKVGVITQDNSSYYTRGTFRKVRTSTQCRALGSSSLAWIPVSIIQCYVLIPNKAQDTLRTSLGSVHILPSCVHIKPTHEANIHEAL